MQKLRSKKMLLLSSILLLIVLAFTPALSVGQMGSILKYGMGSLGTLTPQIPMGIFLFEGYAGDLVTVHVATTDGRLNPMVTMVGPSQQPVATNDDDHFMPFSRDAYVSVYLPESGVYSILVTSSDGSMGDYLLRLDGRPVSQFTLLLPNMPVDVDIPPSPPVFYFTFTADPSCPTTLTITDLDSGLPLTFPFTAVVRDQDGTRIALLQGGRALEDSVTVMPGSGVYEVEVSSADIYASGRVRLEVGCIDSAPICRAPGAGRLLPLPPSRTRIPTPTPGVPGRPTPPPRATPQSGQPICGDGIVQADRGEVCDPPNGTNCDTQCQNIISQRQPYCGDGIVQADRGEVCDPPDGVKCDNQCQLISLPQPYCGDGIVQGDRGEQCDPPDGVKCDNQCQNMSVPQPYCGDNIVQPENGEVCDPPDGVKCDNQCQNMSVPQPYCGDGIVQADRGEQCDPPNGVTCTDSSYKGGACLIIPG